MDNDLHLHKVAITTALKARQSALEEITGFSKLISGYTEEHSKFLDKITALQGNIKRLKEEYSSELQTIKAIQQRNSKEISEPDKQTCQTIYDKRFGLLDVFAPDTISQAIELLEQQIYKLYQPKPQSKYKQFIPSLTALTELKQQTDEIKIIYGELKAILTQLLNPFDDLINF